MTDKSGLIMIVAIFAILFCSFVFSVYEDVKFGVRCKEHGGIVLQYSVACVKPGSIIEASP